MWLFVLGSAVVLELLQIVMADQDAQIIYAVKKPTGGVTDLEAAHVLFVYSDQLVQVVSPRSRRDERSGIVPTALLVNTVII